LNLPKFLAELFSPTDHELFTVSLSWSPVYLGFAALLILAGIPGSSRADVPVFTISSPAPPYAFGGPNLFGQTGTIEGDIADSSPLVPASFSVAFGGGSTSTVVSSALDGNHFKVEFNLAGPGSDGGLGVIIPSGLSPGGYVARVSSVSLSVSDVDGNTTGYVFPIYIDDRAPGLSINLPGQNGGVAPFSKLTGTVIDFSPIQTLTLLITDGGTPPNYWDGAKFTTTPVAPVDLDIPGNSTIWSYSGFTSDEMDSDQTYVLTLTGTDSFGNIGISSQAIQLAGVVLNDAVGGVTPGAKSAFNITFSDSKFTIQYSAKPSRVNSFTNSLVYCGSWNNGASDPGYTLVSAGAVNGANGPTNPQKITDAGCPIAMKISANTDNWCVPNDTIYVMSGNNPVGQLDGSILIPRDIQYTKTDANVNIPTGSNYSTVGQQWTQTLTGAADMDLTQQKFGENIVSVEVPVTPLIPNWTYPKCGSPEAKINFFPDPDMSSSPPDYPFGCDPNHLTSGPNRFCDRFEVLNVNPSRPSYVGSLIGAPLAGIVCATEIVQTYFVNACVFPKTGQIHNTIEEHTSNSPNVVTVERSFP
jgi:hypothetical protein